MTAQAALEYCLTLRCQGGFEHAHIIGGNRISKAAGVWPYGLVSAMIAGATQELALRSALLPVIARQHERCRGHVAWNEETIHFVADELYLRPDIIVVMTPESDDSVPNLPKGTVRKIVLVCGDNGRLADYADHYHWEKRLRDRHPRSRLFGSDVALVVAVIDDGAAEGLWSYPVVRPDFRMRPIDAYPAGIDDDDDADMPDADADSSVPQEPPRRRRRTKGPELRPAQVPPNAPPPDRLFSELDAGGRDPRAEEPLRDNFGPKPGDITHAQWGALKKLHAQLCHPPTDPLVRMLRRWGATPAVLDAVKNLDCVICQSVRRPAISRPAAFLRSEAFNENAFVEEFDTTLSDRSKVLWLMTLDDASIMRIAVRTGGSKNISGIEARQAYEAGWTSWAGPPETLFLDPAKGHITKQFADVCGKMNTVLHLIPAEQPSMKGRIGRAIDFWKDIFSKVKAELNLTKNDDMQMIGSMINWACNNHIRKNGFTPYQYMLGRSPRVPGSLTAVMEDGVLNLPAHDRILHNEPARRAESVRLAASKAFFELDSDEAARRALTARTRPLRQPYVEGQVVYWFRAQGTRTMSKRLQQETGWHGPALVLKQEGHSHVYIS